MLTRVVRLFQYAVGVAVILSLLAFLSARIASTAGSGGLAPYFIFMCALCISQPLIIAPWRDWSTTKNGDKAASAMFLIVAGSIIAETAGGLFWSLEYRQISAGYIMPITLIGSSIALVASGLFMAGNLLPKRAEPA